jgi:hypothetical protein
MRTMKVKEVQERFSYIKDRAAAAAEADSHKRQTYAEKLAVSRAGQTGHTTPQQLVYAICTTASVVASWAPALVFQSLSRAGQAHHAACGLGLWLLMGLGLSCGTT